MTLQLKFKIIPMTEDFEEKYVSNSMWARSEKLDVITI
jgi:hypothetical protein